MKEDEIDLEYAKAAFDRDWNNGKNQQDTTAQRTGKQLAGYLRKTIRSQSACYNSLQDNVT